MDPLKLSIRLAQEAKRWDRMVDRVADYLESKNEQRKEKRKEYIAEVEAQANAGKIDDQKNEDLKKQLTRRVQEEEEQAVGTTDALGVTRKKTYKAEDRKKMEHEADQKNKLKKEFFQYFELSYGSKEQEFQDKIHDDDFSKEEMNLIACALKNEIGQVRDSLKTLDIMMNKPKFDQNREWLEKYQTGLRRDLFDIGTRHLKLLKNYIFPVTYKTTPLILFTKLKADIHRYIAENGWCEQITVNHRAWARDAYKIAEQYCQFEDEFHAGMSVDGEKYERISSIKLGVYLNQAIFMWHVEQKKKEALRLLNRTIRNALDSFERWPTEEFEDIRHQVELIQENILLWKEDVTTDSEEED